MSKKKNNAVYIIINDNRPMSIPSSERGKEKPYVMYFCTQRLSQTTSPLHLRSGVQGDGAWLAGQRKGMDARPDHCAGSYRMNVTPPDYNAEYVRLVSQENKIYSDMAELEMKRIALARKLNKVNNRKGDISTACTEKLLMLEGRAEPQGTIYINFEGI
jgi:hypothetical protein